MRKDARRERRRGMRRKIREADDAGQDAQIARPAGTGVVADPASGTGQGLWGALGKGGAGDGKRSRDKDADRAQLALG